ncbi:MAG: type IV pilin protein [Gammaproteobacteria bacterium]|nr:type IV pilin protein [Gammaproteobacteria bacterium]
MKFSQKSSRGFTLTELVIAISVISILAAVGYPAYSDYTYKARRTSATGSLLNLAGRMERYYADQNTYATATIEDLMGEIDVENSYYDLSFKMLASNAYTLQATPSGIQRGDKCGTYTLDSLGAKDVESATLARRDCW